MAACSEYFRSLVTAFMGGHAILTTGKNIPLPREQGLVKGECMPAITTVSGHLAPLVTGRISCGGETCTYSVQVGTGIFCTSIAYHCGCFVPFLSSHKYHY